MTEDGERKLLLSSATGPDSEGLPSPSASKQSNSVKSRTSDDQKTGCGKSVLCDPQSPCHRFIALLLMSLLSFGGYFCYDNPSALADILQTDFKLSTVQYMAFYSWYGWPNVFLCFFNGFLIDRVFGVRWGAIIFSFILMAGQALFALGGLLDTYWLMCVGRLFFGIGNEALAVAQKSYMVTWFKEDFNLVFGIQLCLARIGSTANMNLMRPLYELFLSYGVLHGYEAAGMALFAGGATCTLGVICSIALAIIDSRAERILKKQQRSTVKIISAADLKDVLLSGQLWMVSLICVAFYVTIFPFIGMGLVFFEMKYDMMPSHSAICNSLPYILSAIGSPLCGFLIDRTGRNLLWMIAGTLVLMGSHALLGFTFISPYIGMAVMGIGFSMMGSVIWPMLAYFIPDHKLNSAYGLMKGMQNLGLASIAIASGAIVDSEGYLVVEVFNITWLSLALMLCILFYFWDSSYGGLLNMSTAERRKRKEGRAIN